MVLVKGLLFVKYVNLTQSGAYMVLKIKITDQYLINSGNQRRIFPPNILTYRLYTYMHPICNLEIINKFIYMCI